MVLLVYKNIKKLSLNIKFRIFNPFYYCADRVSFYVLFSCLKSRQETQPELHQTFEVNTAQTSGLANLVFSRQTGFASASIRFSPEARTLKEGFRTMIGSEKV